MAADDPPTWSAQVDAELDDRLHDYRMGAGLSKSETVRNLLRKGIQAESDPDSAVRQSVYLVGSGMFLLFGWTLNGLHETFGQQTFARGAEFSIVLAGAFLLLYTLAAFDWARLGGSIRRRLSGGGR